LTPPIAFRPNSRQARYLRQSLTLTALGRTSFEKILASIARVHTLFDRSIGENRLQACSIFTTFEDVPAVDMSNRYFTPRTEATISEIMVLGNEIDPQGFLARAAGPNYVHTEENMVYYYEKRQGSQEGGYKYVCRNI